MKNSFWTQLDSKKLEKLREEQRKREEGCRAITTPTGTIITKKRKKDLAPFYKNMIPEPLTVTVTDW